MRNRTRQSGISLIEVTLVTAIMALLTVLSLPAIRMFSDSLTSVGDGRTMISAAMASARAIAAREQKYVGIRFQTEYKRKSKNDPSDDPLEASQYMIYIIHDPKKMKLANGFRAVEGLQPIKLPDGIGVMDLYENVNLDIDLEIRDAMTFSIIFSPAGKLIIHEVRVRNRDGKYQPANLNESRDDIFNSLKNIVDNETGIFVQDDYKTAMGLGEEYSRRRFVIYDRRDFKQIDSGRRHIDFVDISKKKFMVYINPYTGLMLENYVK